METEAHLSGIISTFIVAFQPLTPGMVAEVIIAFLLLIVSCMTAGCELAFFTLSSASRSKLEKKQIKKVKTLLQLLANLEELMASLLVANIFFKVVIVIISFSVVNSLIPFGTLPTWGIIALVLVINFFCFFFCEIISKMFAIANPEKYTLTVTYPVNFLHQLFIPVATLFYRTVNVFNKKIIYGKSQISADNLTNAIEIASDTHTDEEDILKGIVKFGNIDVREISKPRIDVVAIDFNMLLKQVLATVVEAGYSRIPVYAENFDNIRGILYVKDLLPFINEKDNFRWQSLIRPPYFVPETKKVKELLTEFQANKIHMAVIVDEYGGTLGIVTLEDILEEIVGEITDESDEDKKSYTQINSNTYIFDGKTLLNDFYKIIQTENNIFDEIKGEADTLAGLILELKGAIPALNEQIKYKQFTFKIEAVDSRRIKQIKVIIKKEKNG